MSEPEPNANPGESEEYPGSSRWDNLPGDIVIDKREGTLLSTDESELNRELTPEQLESQRIKFSWEPGDVVVDDLHDPDVDDDEDFD